MHNNRLRREKHSIAPMLGMLLSSLLLWCCCPSRPATTEVTPASPPPAQVVAPSVSPVERLRAELDTLFDDPIFANTFWGVRVETLDGDVLYDRNGGKGFVPASNLKLYSSAATLGLLGADYQYETRVEAIGPISADGILSGDVVIIGSGDPSLGSWHVKGGSGGGPLLREWAARIREAGIREIHGDIIGDGRYFTPEYYSSTWELGDLPYWYATGSSGLAFEENCFRFITAPGPAVGAPAQIRINPDTKYITVINDTVTTVAGGPTTADIVWRNTEDNVVRFEGTIAHDSKEFQQRGSIWDGPMYAAWLLRETLEREGIKVHGNARNILSLDVAECRRRVDEATDRRQVATYTSPPMSELLAILNKPSHNFYGDQMVRTLGHKFRGTGSFSAGVEAAKAWFKKIGVPDAELVMMFDGSGMARRTVVQPRQTCALLRHMYSNETLRQTYLDSLPAAGVDGTLRTRMQTIPPHANVRAKTGFITRSRCLSGYLNNADGDILVFSMMANQFTVLVRTVNQYQDQAVAILAQFSKSAAPSAAQQASAP
jgi:D-alanyl-D-alanine carboxypeptidase/D-alanyl-D-alanine-endopeptidase (penicillin-binding protein 4)